MRKMLAGILVAMMVNTTQAQIQAGQGIWKAQLHRADGHNIVFNFELRREEGKNTWYILNASERMRVDNITVAGDSLLVQMPFFESQFRLKPVTPHQITGLWIRSTSKGQIQMPFTAELGDGTRFDVKQAAAYTITGRWAAYFRQSPAAVAIDTTVGEFEQKGNILSGSILTSTGDYRYLGGVVSGDTLKLSTFDGVHAYLFTAKINNNHTISGGDFYSGPVAHENWTAQKDANATLPNDAAMYLKPGEGKLNFRFPDLNNHMVSINDARFKNKVVVIQIMGSWCPNCMDETAFLSEFYQKNKHRGVEIVGLAYEYSTDFERSRKSLMKFKERFNVQYPILVTGVTVMDERKTEKTLPQLTPIKSFPSTIFLDKTGKVAKLEAGFTGPGTGYHYEEMKKEFNETIDRLLQ
jgi:thiol-disulfide isomerase/thioredoxin